MRNGENEAVDPQIKFAVVSRLVVISVQLPFAA